MKRRFKFFVLVFVLAAMALSLIGNVVAAEPTQDLADLSPIYFDVHSGAKSIAGINYNSIYAYYWEGIFGFQPGDKGYAEYNLGYKYEKLTAVAGMADDQSDASGKGRIKIYGDNVLLYDSSDLALGQKKDISINVSNVLRLKIEYTLVKIAEDKEVIVILGDPTLTIKDTTPPSVTLSVPKVSSNLSTATSFPVTYSVSDPSPASGVKSWKLQIKTGSGGTWTNWKTGSTGISSTKKYFTGSKGKTYYFRLIATDNKSNSKTSSTVYSMVPFDNGSFTYSSGWGKWSYYKNYGGFTRYNNVKGSWAKFSFTGSSVYLIAPKSPNLGKADIYVDNVYQKTIDLFAWDTKYRQVVFSKSLSGGSHTLKVVVKNKKNYYSNSTYVHIDGVAVRK